MKIDLTKRLLFSVVLTAWLIVGLVNISLADGGDDGGTGNGGGSAQPVNVIRNGGFELRESNDYGEFGVEWLGYSNGQAHFGWYDEQWREAVYSGEHAQLMEIKEVYNNQENRVMAIYQTVEVVPNSTYNLTLYAMVRSDAGIDYRNIGEYEMSWGIDYTGEGNYNTVTDWVAMPLTEQSRIGSSGEFPDNEPLFYEMITGKVEVESSQRITLFIRGLKKFTNTTEYLFDVDEVSLVGPIGATSAPSTSTTTTSVVQPAGQESNLPDSGGIVAQQMSTGNLVLGGLVLVFLGVSATAGLLRVYNRG